MIINNNLCSLNAQRQLNIVENNKKKSSEKLSSGYKINKASDDAANLAISETMRRQIRGLNQGSYNIQDGISLCQVADGALKQVHDMLHRMTELAVKASNDTLTDKDRVYIQDEVNCLSEEINRIGHTTKFNEQLIFDSEIHEVDTGSITQLVSCVSAEKGYLGEAYRLPSGTYMPAAYVDFSGVNESNIESLNGGNFGFNCCRGCQEVFDITFATDGTPSSALNLGDASHLQEHHYYTIDISNCKSGSDVVDAILGYVGDHLPYPRVGENNPSYGDLLVSHSNNLAKVGNSKLCIYANKRVIRYGTYIRDGYATAEDAANAYPIPGYPVENAGKVFCSNIVVKTKEEPILNWRIQCSSDYSDFEEIKTPRMDAKVIGVDPLDVSTSKNASGSIEKVKKAMAIISDERSNIGAYQNRMIHAYKSTLNTYENTQASESHIRDTDMEKEIMEISKHKILEQSENSIISQANQTHEGVMKLLQ